MLPSRARVLLCLSTSRVEISLFSTWLDPVVLYRVTNWWCHFAFNLSLFAFNPPRSRAFTHFAIKTEWVEISRQITDITRKCEQSRRLFVKHWIHHMFVVCLFQFSQSEVAAAAVRVSPLVVNIFSNFNFWTAWAARRLLQEMLAAAEECQFQCY